MAKTILSRYLDPEVLSRLSGRRIEPRGLVLGNLAGAHKSPLAGFAVEFAGHREYVVGDDLKHLDWRVYYKRQRFFVKQYEMETNFVCHLLLDCSASMRYGQGAENKLAYAARLIAALGHAIVRQSDKVSFASFDEQVRGFVAPGNSLSQIIRMTELIDQCPAVNKTRMSDCLGELLGRTKRREIVMIFSDFFTDLDELERPLQQMRYRRHEVVLFQVMHRDELTFDLDETTKFVGLEAPEELLAEPGQIRRAYLRALERFQTRFDDICRRNRIERVVVDTSRDAGEVLSDYLNQRSRMHRGR